MAALLHVSASTGQLFNAPGIISTDLAADALVVTFTGAPVTAIVAISGDRHQRRADRTAITLTLSDGTIETFTSTGPTDSVGS